MCSHGAVLLSERRHAQGVLAVARRSLAAYLMCAHAGLGGGSRPGRMRWPPCVHGNNPWSWVDGRMGTRLC